MKVKELGIAQLEDFIQEAVTEKLHEILDFPDMNVEQLKTLIHEAVVEKFRDVLVDPDQDLELKEEIKAKLRDSLMSVEQGKKGVPIERTVKKLGLEWK